ncbi:coiled-coil domain-containing protein 127-like [Mustelus asterias]
MNNLSKPTQNWNIPPNRQDGGGDGNKWNFCYFFLPILGGAALHFIQARKSQKEREQVIAAQKMANREKEIELKYNIRENQHRRLLSRSESEKEKLKNKVQSYHQILSAQRQQLDEERRQLQEGINIEEKTQAVSKWESQARSLIKEFQDSLLTRQSSFCSSITSRNQRTELERKMLHQAATNPIAKELGIEADLNNIFKYETHCAGKLNKDKRENGRIMWVYLTYWRFQTKLKILENEADKLGKQDN